MSYRKDLPKSLDDIEKPRETIADWFADGPGAVPLIVRLGDLWNDLYRAAYENHDLEVPQRSVPLLDDMKVIRHWD
jgi:hypothetical protein